MALVIQNSGENYFLKQMIINNSENLSLKLFQSDTDISGTTVLGDLVEANFDNYTTKSLLKTNWTTVATNVSGEAQTDYNAEQSWTCGVTGNTVYGYYVVSSTTQILLWAERFSTPRILSDGDVVRFTPSLTFRSQNGD